MVVLIPNLLGAYFGRLNYPKIVGWMAPAVTLLSSVSPILAGMLFDTTGTYFLPFAITAVLLFLSVSAAHFARPPRCIS
jgi:cyanate permease